MKVPTPVCLLAFFLLSLVQLAHPTRAGHGPHVLSLVNVAGIKVDATKLVSASISVSPSTIQNGGYVNVSFSSSTPQEDDWIAAYSPSTVDITQTTPIKYQFAKKSPEYLSSGSGSLTLNLINMRADYILVFYRGGLNSPIKVATSNIVTFANLNEPLKPRLSTTTSPSEMLLMWSSATTANPVVKYGTQSGVYTQSASATTSTYGRKDMCDEPATTVGYRDIGPIHKAVLTGLVPGNSYYYIFGDGSNMSQEFSFKQPPLPAENQEVRLLAFGDMGQSATDDSLQYYEEPPSLNTTKWMARDVGKGSVDAIFHIGDISYARGYESEWDMFLEQISPLASRVPYFVCLGNHEMDSPNSNALFKNHDSGGECGVPMENLFANPHATLAKPWYSIEIGSIHAVFMSTEHEFTKDSPQHAWLEQDLASVDRTKTPWLVFSGHRPMYIDADSSVKGSDGDQTVAKELRKHVEPLLYKYKVDLAFWGHHHSYQRMCAVCKETCLQKSNDGVYGGPWKATVHVVIGMGGQHLSKNLEPTPPPYAEYVNADEWGYTRLHFKNSTHFHMEFLSNALDGKVREEFWIMRD